MSKTIATDAERFWKRVDKADGCWIWVGCLNKYGYGTMSINNSSASAHRYSYELNVGPIPKGLQLDHLCRVRSCVNPAHLEPVTNRENQLRGKHVALRKFCKRGHDLSVTGTKSHPSAPNKRLCAACLRLREQQANERRMALRAEQRAALTKENQQ